MEIILKVEPNAMARTKTVFRGGRSWAFTPTKTRNAQDELIVLLRQQITHSFPVHTPIKLTMCFYRTKPKSTSDAMPVRKPDLDNFVKCMDALNGIAFPDDAQVTKLMAIKRWTTTGYPYIVIGIEEDKL